MEAFRLMNNSGHIKYLGGAFFTKWISFASARGSVDAEDVAPIFDKRVRDWIDLNTRGTRRMNLSTTSTDGYAKYLALLDSWRNGADWSRTRVQVELAIFDLTRDRREVTQPALRGRQVRALTQRDDSSLRPSR